ncbi:7508_t:CDS:1, partial [Cetraspora pellucida]
MNNFSEMRTCTCCEATKPINKFMRLHKTENGLFANCNHCSEQKKQSMISKNLINENTIQINTLNHLLPEGDPKSDAKNNNKGLVYEIKDLEELIATNFLNCEENKYIKFLFIIELNDEFIKEALLNKYNQNNNNEQSFYFIVNALFVFIETR